MAEMTAMEYLKEKCRMTESCNIYCGDCPLSIQNNNKMVSCKDLERVFPEAEISAVQEWAEKHHVKTILMDLLEKYPNANSNAIIMELCPDTIGYPKDGDICENGEYENRCQKCWNRPLEE